MDEILQNLNEEQIKPVMDTEGAVLVLAGAGSGKTRVLTSRIAYILERGLCAPANILAITFTNKAAKEMRDRLEGMLGDLGAMWICTIHSMCVRILRRFGGEIGVQPNFSIYSEAERNTVIKKAFGSLDYDNEKLLKSVKFHIANAKTLGLSAEEYKLLYKDEAHIEDVAAIYENYERRLKENNALDFDDLLIKALALLKKRGEALEYLSDKFAYVLVDEFQDTNAVQYSIIKLLSSAHGNLFVVGDDDQSIYGWRGAEIKNILQFDRDYPQAKVYKLERNYRSTKSILSLANKIIANNGKRRKKTLWTEAEEGVKPEYVQSEQEADEAYFAAKTINSAVYNGGKYSDFAVLMRINALTRSYEQEFTKYGIPYKVIGGFKFFERKEIKDVLAYMRLICNPFDDEAFSRIINVPKRGIGDKTIAAMEEYSRPPSLSLYDACIDVDELPVSPSAKGKIKEFTALMKELIIISQSEDIGALTRAIISRSALKTAYDDGTEEGDAKLSNLDEFIAAVDDFKRLNPSAGLQEYLNQVTLASDVDEMDDGNYVTLATIHSVKGLEFDSVFICGMEEGIMPSSRSESDPAALEEERRLMYVAITRARKRLWITRSKSRYLYGRREPTRPSIFLLELKDELGFDDSSVRFYGGDYGRRNYRSSGYTSGSIGRNNGYDGDFWESGKPRRGVYSSDEGYSPDYPQRYDKTPPYGSSYGEKSGSPYSSSYGTSGGSAYGGGTSNSSSYGSFSAAKSFNGGRFSGSGSGKGSANSAGGTSSRSGAANAAGGKFSVGTKVRHPKFGVGTVIAMKNGGNVLDIAFENQGIRELSATIAPLEIISK